MMIKNENVLNVSSNVRAKDDDKNESFSFFPQTELNGVYYLCLLCLLYVVH